MTDEEIRETRLKVLEKDLASINNRLHHAFNQGFELGRKSITPKEKTGWIPVSERLPEEETDVLACCETGTITVCCGSYSTEVSDTFIWYTGGWRYGKVIAWMPLPEPYVPDINVGEIVESEDKK